MEYCAAQAVEKNKTGNPRMTKIKIKNINHRLELYLAQFKTKQNNKYYTHDEILHFYQKQPGFENMTINMIKNLCCGKTILREEDFDDQSIISYDRYLKLSKNRVDLKKHNIPIDEISFIKLH